MTRNLKIRNNPARVLPNTCRLGQVRDTKFGENVSNEILLNAAKCQGFHVKILWHGNETFPKGSSDNEIVPHLVTFQYNGVRICLHSCHYQNKKKFTRVALVSFV